MIGTLLALLGVAAWTGIILLLARLFVLPAWFGRVVLPRLIREQVWGQTTVERYAVPRTGDGRGDTRVRTLSGTHRGRRFELVTESECLGEGFDNSSPVRSQWAHSCTLRVRDVGPLPPGVVDVAGGGAKRRRRGASVWSEDPGSISMNCMRLRSGLYAARLRREVDFLVEVAERVPPAESIV
ncbi:hypothetical protein F0L68_37920 [Solihabitans fulvus]|uniref:Uncharacterized protein n=1 Tax=Solihabitans fulvus TaxID=1892852 RepID=A0A5B2WJX1_9PSEU|nr:hypothetical protein [Solihabitans fulvus]KAA2251204.1 hypothetical protein F0L68_37920 [Solihabitans fulvus]